VDVFRENPQALRPKKRSRLRLVAGRLWYTGRRTLWWAFGRHHFARVRKEIDLPCEQFRHSTPIYRRLNGADPALQRGKAVNLALACARLDRAVLYPGDLFSYWKLIGKPTRRKGYREGMVLFCGTVASGVGGGLCQLSNLVYWMTLHTPLTVVERWRHSYDVFPDVNRTQPFGSGATCVYNYRDLTIRNDTSRPFQLRVSAAGKDLTGCWRSTVPPFYTYRVYEKEHCFRQESWGGYTRNNVLYRKIYDGTGKKIGDEYITENHALMMYPPFLSDSAGRAGKSGPAAIP
jgi:Uncharacterized vancomycin resistance protein